MESVGRVIPFGISPLTIATWVIFPAYLLVLWAKSNAGNDMVIATIPNALRPNVSNLFFTAFDHTLKKALGCRISGNSIVANNLSAGNAFWVAVTYVKK